MPTGRTSGQDSAIGRNLLAEIDPLSHGHPRRIGDTPDDIILEFIHSTVVIPNFPHHLNEPAATFVVQKLIELEGEMVEIDGGPVDRGRFLEQPWLTNFNIGQSQFCTVRLPSAGCLPGAT
jgi:hypothetical protein